MTVGWLHDPTGGAPAPDAAGASVAVGTGAPGAGCRPPWVPMTASDAPRRRTLAARLPSAEVGVTIVCVRVTLAPGAWSFVDEVMIGGSWEGSDR